VQRACDLADNLEEARKKVPLRYPLHLVLINFSIRSSCTSALV
jgi:hypothetical protein